MKSDIESEQNFILVPPKYFNEEPLVGDLLELYVSEKRADGLFYISLRVKGEKE